MWFNFSNINSKHIANVTLQHVLYSGVEDRAFLCVLLFLGKKHVLHFGLSHLTSTNKKKCILIVIKFSLCITIHLVFINKNGRPLICSWNLLVLYLFHLYMYKLLQDQVKLILNQQLIWKSFVNFRIFNRIVCVKK